MSGFEMFCERCGKRYGSDSQTAAGSLPLARRLLRAVGVGGSMPQPLSDAPFLRFCLACRGYSCPDCWNEDAGFCQTCVPLPEPAVVEHVHEPIAAAVAEAPSGLAFDPFVTPGAADPLATQQLATDSLVTDSLATGPWAPWSRTSTPAAVEPVAVAEAFAEADPEPTVAVVEAEPGPEAVTVAVAAEAVIVAEPEAELVAAAEPEPASVSASEPETAVAADAEPVVGELEQVASLAMAERPIELVVADEEPAMEQEAESEVRWDWTLEPEEPVVAVVAEPVSEADDPEAVLTAAEVTAQTEEAVQLEAVDDESAEPVVASEEEVVVAAEESEPPAAAEEPAALTEPTRTPPVFRPLTPLGPIVAPPPPIAATPIPRIEFELPDVPPAFVIAPPRPSPVARPVLPLGLFDGPGPAIRPCPSCALPVSAKAHFCRRCGSAQS